jgi:hypothetical protein
MKVLLCMAELYAAWLGAARFRAVVARPFQSD